MCILCEPSIDLNILTSVQCIGCSTLTSIPKGLVNLKEMGISHCLYLTKFPSDLVNLSYMFINNSPLLTTLPSEMTNLIYLGILNCPLLYIPQRTIELSGMKRLKSSSNIVRIRSAQLKAKRLYCDRIATIRTKLIDIPLIYPIQSLLVEYI